MTDEIGEHTAPHIKGVDTDTLRQYFPHLYQEFQKDSKKDGVEVPREQGEVKIERERMVPKKDPLRGYIPTYKDYLARARTYEECVEIIDYLESRGEISEELAGELRRTLEVEGPEGFGTREDDYYSKFVNPNRLT